MCCFSYPKVFVFARMIALARVSKGHEATEPKPRTKFNNIVSDSENSMLVSEPWCMHAGGKMRDGVDLKENAKWRQARVGTHPRQPVHIKGLCRQLCVHGFNRVQIGYRQQWHNYVFRYHAQIMPTAIFRQLKENQKTKVNFTHKEKKKKNSKTTPLRRTEKEREGAEQSRVRRRCSHRQGYLKATYHA